MNTPIKDRIHARALAALRDRWPRCTYCGEKHARPSWTRASMHKGLQAYSSAYSSESSSSSGSRCYDCFVLDGVTRIHNQVECNYKL